MNNRRTYPTRHGSRNRYKGVVVSRRLRQAIYRRDRYRCLVCGADLSGAEPLRITLDHVRCESEGGDNHPRNLYCCCRACNSSRQDQSLEEFAPEAVTRIRHHAGLKLDIPMPTRKTDNANLEGKLALRRHFLDRYHERPEVLDCCQGSGEIWTRLRREYDLASYWGLDVKPKKGRLKLDSVRVLEMPGWVQDVIDIDTYGSPWAHWEALLPNVSRPTTVFLTLGDVNATAMNPFAHAGKSFGFPESTPRMIAAKVAREMDVEWMLPLAIDCGLEIREAVEVGRRRSVRARYLGVHLVPESA